MTGSVDETTQFGIKRHAAKIASVALLLVQAALIGPLAFRYGMTPDEPGHLAAGVAVVAFGRFDLYSVNPPLVKAVAAVPAVAAGASTDWTTWQRRSPEHRSEFSVGTHLSLSNSEQYPRLLTFARLGVLPLVLVGGIVCFLWGRDLAGPAAGLVAQALYTFCPNILGNGALITPDAAAASLGVVAGYAFWRWLERPAWPAALTAGIALGLCELTKFTWLILFVLWPVVWLVRHWLRGASESRLPASRQLGQLVMLLVTGLFVIHCGYGFDRPVWKLGDPTFVSIALAGDDSPAGGGEGGNRFRGTWLGEVPFPLPQMLVRGVDLQKLDFDEGRESYMAGTWRFGGWHEFYLYASLVKLPLGTLALIVLALFAPPRGSAARWLAVLLPGIALFLLVSSETGFTRFFRYVLPALPFAFVWAGRAVDLATSRPGRLLVSGCLVATVASSLWIWPHSLSYFNEAAGGPSNGWRHLLDANLDWGQDLPRLAEWQQAHPEATPLYLATYGQLVPEIYGLKDERAPNWQAPGWYAVGLTELHKRQSSVKWLRKREPVERIGYSMLIFHVEPDEHTVESEE